MVLEPISNKSKNWSSNNYADATVLMLSLLNLDNWSYDWDIINITRIYCAYSPVNTLI